MNASFILLTNPPFNKLLSWQTINFIRKYTLDHQAIRHVILGSSPGCHIGDIPFLRFTM